MGLWKYRVHLEPPLNLLGGTGDWNFLIKTFLGGNGDTSGEFPTRGLSEKKFFPLPHEKRREPGVVILPAGEDIFALPRHGLSRGVYLSSSTRGGALTNTPLRAHEY